MLYLCLCRLCLVCTQCRTLHAQFHFRFDMLLLFLDYSQSTGEGCSVTLNLWNFVKFFQKISYLFLIPFFYELGNFVKITKWILGTLWLFSEPPPRPPFWNFPKVLPCSSFKGLVSFSPLGEGGLSVTLQLCQPLSVECLCQCF